MKKLFLFATYTLSCVVLNSTPILESRWTRTVNSWANLSGDHMSSTWVTGPECYGTSSETRDIDSTDSTVYNVSTLGPATMVYTYGMTNLYSFTVPCECISAFYSQLRVNKSFNGAAAGNLLPIVFTTPFTGPGAFGALFTGTYVHTEAYSDSAGGQYYNVIANNSSLTWDMVTIYGCRGFDETTSATSIPLDEDPPPGEAYPCRHGDEDVSSASSFAALTDLYASASSVVPFPYNTHYFLRCDHSPGPTIFHASPGPGTFWMHTLSAPEEAQSFPPGDQTIFPLEYDAFTWSVIIGPQ